MHSKGNNIKVMTYYNAHEVVKEFFESLLSRYQIGLERSMTESNFIFGSVELLHHKCHKINFKRVESYTESPDWIGNKKATIYLGNKDDRCFEKKKYKEFQILNNL